MELHRSTRLLAAKALIKNADGKVLVLQQSHEAAVSNAGQYHMPGGIIEPNETIAEGLIREIREETGLTATIGALVTVGEWQATIRGQHFAFVGIFYECTVPAGEITIDPAESEGYTWVGLAELPTIKIVEPARSILEQYLQQ